MFKSIDEVFNEGYRAFRNKQSRGSCPYSVWRLSYWTWVSGWFSGEIEESERKIERLDKTITRLNTQRETLEKSIRDLSAASTLLQRQVSREAKLVTPTPTNPTVVLDRHPTLDRAKPAQIRNIPSSSTTTRSRPYSDPYWNQDTESAEDLASMAMQAAAIGSVASLTPEPIVSPSLSEESVCAPTPAYDPPSYSSSYSSSCGSSGSSYSSGDSGSSYSSSDSGGSCGGGGD